MWLGRNYSICMIHEDSQITSGLNFYYTQAEISRLFVENQIFGHDETLNHLNFYPPCTLAYTSIKSAF